MTSAVKRLKSLLLWAALALGPATGAGAQPADMTHELDQVVAAFRLQGLQPVGKHGFRQPTRWIEQSILAKRSTVALVADGRRDELKLGEELAMEVDLPLSGHTDASLVFVGYGLPAHTGGGGDFAGLDLRGKVLVAVANAPAGLSQGEADRIRQTSVYQTMARMGAVGMITIQASGHGVDSSPAIQGPTGFYMDVRGSDGLRPGFSAVVSQVAAGKLFDRSGRSFAEISATARAGRPLVGFALNKTLTASLTIQRRAVEEVAALAVLPGSDPTVQNEYVVVTARLSSVETLANLLQADKGRRRRPTLYAAFSERSGRNATGRALVAQNLHRAVVAGVLSIQDQAVDRVGLRGAGDSSLGAEAERLAAAQKLPLVRGALSAEDDLSLADAPLLALSPPGGEAAGALRVNFNAYVAALVRNIANAPERPSWSADSRFAPPQPSTFEEYEVFVMEMPVGHRGLRLVRGMASLGSPPAV